MSYSTEDYTAKISVASPLQLVIINYELMLEHIKGAKSDFQNECVYNENIDKAVQFNGLLIDSLDMSFSISMDLMPLYIYVNKLLIGAKISKEKGKLDEAEKIMSNLLESWLQLERDGFSGEPVIEGAEQIYAGLTYSKGELNEVVMDTGNRGFKA